MLDWLASTGGVVEFLGGYLVILLVPGPNMLSVASIASLGGLRAAMPLCIGIAAGVGGLCAVVVLTTGLKMTDGTAAHVAGAVLLIWVAVRVARGRARHAVGRRRATTIFAVGFVAALTNPLTGSYFLSAALSMDRTDTGRAILPVAITGTAFVFYVAIAAMLANPVARRAAMRWNRPVRIAAAALLLAMAIRTAWPVLDFCADF